jgi:hypothetical protein
MGRFYFHFREGERVIWMTRAWICPMFPPGAKRHAGMEAPAEVATNERICRRADVFSRILKNAGLGSEDRRSAGHRPSAHIRNASRRPGLCSNMNRRGEVRPAKSRHRFESDTFQTLIQSPFAVCSYLLP